MKRSLVPVLAAIAVTAVFLTTACPRGGGGPCGKAIKQLMSPATAKEALRDIGDLKGECAKALPQMEKMFEDGKYRDDIVRTVKKIGDKKHPSAIAILQKALKDKESAAIAASIIQDWKVTEAKEDLIKLIDDGKNLKARKAAINALLAIDQPENLEPTLLKLLEGDINKQGMEVNVIAAKKLGEMKSEKAIPQLINLLFAKSLKGEVMYQVARRSLLKVGKPAFAPLLETLKGNNKELSEFGKDIGVADWEWADGPEIVQMVGDFRMSEAQVDIVAKIAQKLVEPPGLSDKQVDMWKIKSSNRIKVSMIILGLIANDDIVEKMTEIVGVPDNDIQQRLDGSMVLALIGSEKAQEALIKMFKESDEDLFKAAMLLPLTMGVGHQTLDDFNKALKKEKSQLVKDQYGDDVKPFVAIVEECKDDEACYLDTLKRDPWKPVDELKKTFKDPLNPTDAEKKTFEEAQIKMIAEVNKMKKAALILSRGVKEPKSTVKVLLKEFARVPATETDLRRWILLAVEKLGDKAIIPMLEDLSKQEKDKGKKPNDYWADELEIMVLGWKAKTGTN